MSFLIFICSIFSLSSYPGNPFVEHYEIIPQLGNVKSIATSPLEIFALADNNLLILNKSNFSLKRSILFDQSFDLIGYDRQFSDLWIFNPGIMRFNPNTYKIREYSFSEYANKFAITQDYIYIDAGQKFSLNKRSGELNLISSFPEGLNWYERTTLETIRNYPFLTPYYYLDNSQQSQQPFHQFSITSLYDDGMELYVGTNGYGILKYNKVSWLHKRLVYGPIASRIKNVKVFGDKIYFLSASGISYYEKEQRDWGYLRFTSEITDIISLNNNLIIGLGNTVAKLQQCMIFPMGNFKAEIISLTTDDKYIYVGTNSGLYKIVRGTDVAIQFGPTRHAIYCVFPTQDAMYVGGEFAFYKYDKQEKKWYTLINRGIKDIVQLRDELYLLSSDNQLIQYNPDSIDKWIILPYFNIYDIEDDGEVLYCASYAGIYYYEPNTQLYKLIYNLPRIKYNYVFVADDKILGISNNNIYCLPIRYRD